MCNRWLLWYFLVSKVTEFLQQNSVCEASIELVSYQPLSASAIIATSVSQEALEHYTTSRCVVFGWQPDYFDLSLSVHTITHCCVYKHFKVDTHSQLCKVMYVRVASTVWTVVAGVMIFIHHKSHTYMLHTSGNPTSSTVIHCGLPWTPAQQLLKSI